MRRMLIALAVVSLVPAVAAFGQTIGSKDPAEGGRLWPGKEHGIVGYRVTRKRGEVSEVVKITEKKPWYYFTDGSGKMSSQLIESVAKIEPIMQADIEAASGSAIKTSDPKLASGGAIKAKENNQDDQSQRESELYESRSAARITGRTKARTTARQYSQQPTSTFVDQSQSNSGYTATGIPLHTGPRGGVYHISSGGNKVYQSRSK
jgi:hypothetical protein